MSNMVALDDDNQEVVTPPTGDNTDPIDPPDEPFTTPDVPPIEDEPIEDDVPKGCGHSWIYTRIPNFYDRVRSSLNIGNAITNTTIDYFENAPLAEDYIKSRVPQYAELDNYKRMLFETCIVYMTCYKLCPLASEMRITRQKDPSLEIEFSSSASTERPCDRFLDLVDELVAQINEEEITSFFGFKVTPPTDTCCNTGCCGVKKTGAFIPL